MNLPYLHRKFTLSHEILGYFPFHYFFNSVFQNLDLSQQTRVNLNNDHHLSLTKLFKLKYHSFFLY
jgi:hypothetical protein